MNSKRKKIDSTSVVRLSWTHGIKRIISNNSFIIKILFETSPVYGISIIVEAIRHNLINFLEHTICVSFVLEAIEFHKGYINVVKLIAIFLALDFVAAAISNTYNHYTNVKYRPLAQQRLKSRLYKKAKELDLSCYDNTRYYNDFVLAVSETDRAIERAENLLRLIFSGLTLTICYGAFFISKDITSVIFVLVSVVLKMTFATMLNKLNYKIRLMQNPLERKRNYFRRIFYLNDYAKELRLNKDATKELHEKFNEVNDEILQLNKSIGIKRFWLDFASNYITSDFMLDIIYVLYLVVISTVYHLISYSSVVVLYNSASNLRWGLSSITNIGPYALETSLYMDKILAFLNYKPKINNNKKYAIPVKPCKLECRNVSFDYGDGKKILVGINLIINPNERIALVGHNGAGKTTLIKLLMRLYEPTQGSILLNGIDIREYDIEEYRSYIGVVFQDFKLYATDIKENVVMDIADEAQKDSIVNAINKSGFGSRLETLPNGLKPLLHRNLMRTELICPVVRHRNLLLQESSIRKQVC
jgi:ATP-binding cassette subfamily B protein